MLKRKDPRAAALIYDHFHSDINRIVWVMLGADAEHDDIVHQIFIELLAHIHKVRNAHALRAWVRTVATNTVRRQLRRRIVRRRWRADGSPDEHQAQLSHDDNPEARQMLQHVYTILNELSPELHIVFSLRMIEDLTIAQIAERCSCSESTIKRRLNKAQRLFELKAKRYPELAQRLAQSDKWSTHHD